MELETWLFMHLRCRQGRVPRLIDSNMPRTLRLLRGVDAEILGHVFVMITLIPLLFFFHSALLLLINLHLLLQLPTILISLKSLLLLS